MNKSIQNALKTEESLRKQVELLKNSIFQDISNTEPLDGVSIPSSPRTFACATVKASVLSKTSILSPSYYIPAVQAEVVRRKLAKIQSVSKLMEAIFDMVETGKIRFSGNNVYALNEKTRAALRAYLN